MTRFGRAIRWRGISVGIVLTAAAACVHVRAADEEVFSGPQPGEALPACEVLGVFDDLAGQELDFVEQAAGQPTLLIIVHEVTRPSAALTRALTHYAASRKEDGLYCAVVWLTPDRTEAEGFLKLARNSLGMESPVGISLDGAEGPGAYGLNRNVILTILVANEGQVTGNHALIQPNVTDAPTILEDVVALIGGEVPPLKELVPPMPNR